MSFEVEVSSDLTYDGGKPIQIINAGTEIATGDIAKDPEVQRLAGQLSQWVQNARAGAISTMPGPGGGGGGMLDRNGWSWHENPYQNMRAIRDAIVYDDIMGGVAEATEALAFEGGLKWEAANPDDADIFNQMAADWNLDNVIRMMWRDCFRYDQAVVAKVWGYQSFTVRGRTAKGNARKKTYTDVWAPTRLVTLNSLQVVPIYTGPLRTDALAWQSSEVELNAYRSAVTDDAPMDPLMTQFFSGTYQPGASEAARLGAWGVQNDRLLAMNPDWVFRHTTTRADYEPFAELRMRSVLPLLDLKRQLIASDRAALVGAANYILLIRKGNDNKPATRNEMEALRENYNFLAKIPVIISDHRLEIDIIAPSQDFVLQADKYDTLDNRILHRAMSSFVGRQTAASSSSTFEAVLAKNIQNRRHMIKRTLEREIARAIVDHPRNAGKFSSRPSLVFTPRTVNVASDQSYMSTLFSMRQSREVSRDTILEYMGLDEATEAQRLLVEEELYDPIFKTTSSITGQPVNPDGSTATTDTGTTTDTTTDTTGTDTTGTDTGGTDAGGTGLNGTPESPAVSGRRGGRPQGGRRPSAPKTGRNGRTTDNGNPSTGN